MPVDVIVGGNRNGKPGVMLGNQNLDSLAGPSVLGRPDPKLQLAGVGSGPVVTGQDLVDSNGNVKNPFTSPLLDNLGGKPKNSGGNGWNGMQPVLDFTPQEEEKYRNRRPFVGPPPPSKPADSGPFGPPDTSYSSGGGGDFGNIDPNGDYQYDENELYPKPTTKNTKPDYTEPLIGEKKIV